MTSAAGSGPGVGERTEVVDLGARSTDIRIGSGLYARFWATVRAGFPRAARCGLAIDARVAELWPPPPAPAGLEVLRHDLPAGESAKDRAVLAVLQDRWIGLRRDEPVVVIGGGAALDVGGFAAATVRRGLPWIAVATTVIAMADAAVGGKTAVNHPAGKNLLGVFHPPTRVLSDIDVLATLGARDRVSGLAELYKCGRIGDAELRAQLAAGPPAGAGAWIDLLHRAVAVKARLVEADERDGGVRRLLNYGHTVGHALERVLGNERMRHGEAIAIGMDIAARIAVGRGALAPRARDAQREELARLGLPVDVPPEAERGALLEALGLDKKRPAGQRHVFVLPTAGGHLAVAEDVTDGEIKAALGT